MRCPPNSCGVASPNKQMGRLEQLDKSLPGTASRNHAFRLILATSPRLEMNHLRTSSRCYRLGAGRPQLLPGRNTGTFCKFPFLLLDQAHNSAWVARSSLNQSLVFRNLTGTCPKAAGVSSSPTSQVVTIMKGRNRMLLMKRMPTPCMTALKLADVAADGLINRVQVQYSEHGYMVGIRSLSTSYLLSWPHYACLLPISADACHL